MDIFNTKEGREFLNDTIPALVEELARFNDNAERALDYYAMETFGKVPKGRKESS